MCVSVLVDDIENISGEKGVDIEKIDVHLYARVVLYHRIYKMAEIMPIFGVITLSFRELV